MTSPTTAHYPTPRTLHYVLNRRHRRALQRLCRQRNDDAALYSLSAQVRYYDAHHACRQAAYLNHPHITSRNHARHPLIRLP